MCLSPFPSTTPRPQHRPTRTPIPVYVTTTATPLSRYPYSCVHAYCHSRQHCLHNQVALKRLKKLPTEAAPPHHKAATLKMLGSTDADALKIESRALFSTEERKAKAEAERTRRIEAGIADEVESMQPLQPPTFDQSLVSKRIEVRWKYINTETGEPVYVWSPGRVARASLMASQTRKARELGKFYQQVHCCGHGMRIPHLMSGQENSG